MCWLTSRLQRKMVKVANSQSISNPKKKKLERDCIREGKCGFDLIFQSYKTFLISTNVICKKSNFILVQCLNFKLTDY